MVRTTSLKLPPVMSAIKSLIELVPQARSRLYFVFPGERQYIVVGNEEIENSEQQTKVSEQLPIGIPWYSRLISSITSTNVSN